MFMCLYGQVGRFAQRVSALLESLSAEFERKTAGSALVKERSERLRALQDYTLTSAGRLSQLQFLALEAQTAAHFQKQLLQILREAGGPATEGSADAAGEVRSAQDQALRRSLFWYVRFLARPPLRFLACGCTGSRAKWRRSRASSWARPSTALQSCSEFA